MVTTHSIARYVRKLFPLVVRLLAMSMLVWGSGAIFAAQGVRKEVPFGNQVSAAVTKYNRLRPHIATSGPLKEGAISELKSLGFVTILDLRGSDEGTMSKERPSRQRGCAI